MVVAQRGQHRQQLLAKGAVARLGVVFVEDDDPADFGAGGNERHRVSQLISAGAGSRAARSRAELSHKRIVGSQGLSVRIRVELCLAREQSAQRSYVVQVAFAVQ